MYFFSGKACRKQAGFSLLELSVVVAIISIVSVLGLETATQFLGSHAYTETQTKLSALDLAIKKFYRVYGRLPCPAQRDVSPLNSAYGQEAISGGVCSQILSGTSNAIAAGTVPFRALNLPIDAALDSYGDRINYFVSVSLTTVVNFSAGNGALEIRTGTLQEPCSSASCEVLADPTSTTSPGAAYALFSNGPDKRGAIGKQGNAMTACAGTNDTRIDSQNCVNVTGTGSVSPAIGASVLYDSRYNSGTQNANYYDDAFVWRTKGHL